MGSCKVFSIHPTNPYIIIVFSCISMLFCMGFSIIGVISTIVSQGLARFLLGGSGGPSKYVDKPYNPYEL